jgi:type 2A phosphatase activator TIP41
MIPHQLIKTGNLKEGLTQGITINDWTITSKKCSICNTAEMEK